MNEYENAIEITGLTKQYDGFKLDNVDFSLPKGSIMGFIGQNGAGKTTTIKTILNIVKPDSGSIKIFGKDHIADELEIKADIAAIFDEIPFHDDFTAKQLAYILRDIYKNWDNDVYFQYLDRLSLPLNKKIGQLSKGMKMKLQISAGLSHNAKLLIMDEATTGLDPVVRSEILDIFLEFLQDENNSILMSSHITSDLEKVADSVTFIDKGRILISGYKDDILSNHAIIKCTKTDYKSVDREDIVSTRLTQFGAEILVSNATESKRKYSGLVFDQATLDDIMIYYVNTSKKEWS